MGLHLGTQAQDKTAIRQILQIVAQVGQIHRVAGKGHRDGGHQLHFLCIHGGGGH